MPVSKNINAYEDVRRILDMAVQLGQVEYALDTKGKATHWTQRARAFIKLLLKRDGHTPYDMLVIRPEDSIVHLYIRQPEGALFVNGVRVPLDPIDPPAAPDLQVDDPLLLAALKLAEGKS